MPKLQHIVEVENPKTKGDEYDNIGGNAKFFR